MSGLLRRLHPSEASRVVRHAVEETALRQALEIVSDVEKRGEQALREHAERLGDISPGDPLAYRAEQLSDALGKISDDDRRLLHRVGERIRHFAEAQRSCLNDLDIPVEGGRAGHHWIPVRTAGCYAPGGRFPLPSSVLMTAITARVAGVESVWVASPKPTPITLAAAALAGADGLLAVGGAQAIAAMAFGIDPVPPCDLIVGPGNRWVTAAKYVVSSRVGVDMFAGPSELLVIADATAHPRTVALDLLAQAEHDPDASAMLVSLDESLIARVEEVLSALVQSSQTAEVIRSALQNGFATTVASLAEAVSLADRIGPEHLHLHLAEPGLSEVTSKCRNYGTLFVGAQSVEAAGDYGAGPNHVLPTGGSARYAAGLSVASFLHPRTWLRLSVHSEQLLRDTAALARIEGLEFHARSAEARLETS